MKILGTTEISFHIEQLIKEAEEYLVIVSPYLKINNRLKVELEDSINRCKNSLIIYRENKLSNQEYNWLKNQRKLKLLSIKNLHAKCYLNEKNAVLTSMNLYEFSQINNHELGVLFSASNDSEEYLDLIGKINSILRTKAYNFNFLPLIEQYGKFTMGELAVKLSQNYVFPSQSKNQNTYTFLCQEAKGITRFSNEELYQDGTNILRQTNLGKERFELLYEKLKNLGKPK